MSLISLVHKMGGRSGGPISGVQVTVTRASGARPVTTVLSQALDHHAPRVVVLGDVFSRSSHSSSSAEPSCLTLAALRRTARRAVRAGRVDACG